MNEAEKLLWRHFWENLRVFEDDFEEKRKLLKLSLEMKLKLLDDLEAKERGKNEQPSK